MNLTKGMRRKLKRLRKIKMRHKFEKSPLWGDRSPFVVLK